GGGGITGGGCRRLRRGVGPILPSGGRRSGRARSGSPRVGPPTPAAVPALRCRPAAAQGVPAGDAVGRRSRRCTRLRRAMLIEGASLPGRRGGGGFLYGRGRGEGQ